MSLVIDTYEEDDRTPVLRHVFSGGKREAMQIFRAHMKTDSFLRSCELRGKWKKIACRNVKKWRKR